MTERETYALVAHYYLRHFPLESAACLEGLNAADVADAMAGIPDELMTPLWEGFNPDFAEKLLQAMPAEPVKRLLARLEPAIAAAIIRRFSSERRNNLLQALPPSLLHDIVPLIHYPADSVGAYMESRYFSFRPGDSVQKALRKLRASASRETRMVFVVDEHQHPAGRVALHDLALAEPRQLLSQLMTSTGAHIHEMAHREDAVELFDKVRDAEIPVTDSNGRMVGVIRQSAMIHAVQEQSLADMQAMVGASKDEKALSKISFAVKKRLPWLQINLLTAFLAAAVVGVFENTIAKFTALAVLLPVVAGQSGNAGSQALAVTMRGLVLREITMRHWYRVMLKESMVGFYNGLAVAATTAAGVYLWSGSTGLAMIISLAMIIAMVAAGLSGALIPITLRRLGQDPAQSSSIILTTVTDVVGFFSFLGIATLMSGLLK